MATAEESVRMGKGAWQGPRQANASTVLQIIQCQGPGCRLSWKLGRGACGAEAFAAAGGPGFEAWRGYMMTGQAYTSSSSSPYLKIDTATAAFQGHRLNGQITNKLLGTQQVLRSREFPPARLMDSEPGFSLYFRLGYPDRSISWN